MPQSERVTIRLTPSELRRYQAAARAADMPLSRWLRAHIVPDPPARTVVDNLSGREQVLARKAIARVQAVADDVRLDHRGRFLDAVSGQLERLAEGWSTLRRASEL